MSTYGEFKVWFYKRTLECNLLSGSIIEGNDGMLVNEETYAWAEEQLRNFMQEAVRNPTYRVRVSQPCVCEDGSVRAGRILIKANFWPVHIMDGKLKVISPESMPG